MKRILILGPSGTGKTTLSRRLAERLEIPTLHLDTVYWIRDWEHLSKDEFHQWMAHYLKEHPSWVIDGNYTNNRHFDLRLKLADTIILLDYGTQAALKGIHERAATYKHQVRSDMAEGCVEGIDQAFLQYVAFYYKTRMKWLKAMVMRHQGQKRILVFKNRDETMRWLSTL
jgi:adenylate kinase family enzyme